MDSYITQEHYSDPLIRNRTFSIPRCKVIQVTGRQGVMYEYLNADDVEACSLLAKIGHCRFYPCEEKAGELGCE